MTGILKDQVLEIIQNDCMTINPKCQVWKYEKVKNNLESFLKKLKIIMKNINIAALQICGRHPVTCR